MIAAAVNDAAASENAYRSHGELFGSQGAIRPTLLGITGGNVVAVHEQTADLGKLLASLESPETSEAMKADGVKTDAVRIVVLDRTSSF